MIRTVEAFAFLSLAAALHLGVWHFSPLTAGNRAAGDGGADAVTLQAATGAQSQMVAKWQSPPEAQAKAPEDIQPSTAPSDTFLSAAAAIDVPPAQFQAPGLAAPTTEALPDFDANTAALPLQEPQTVATRPKARPASNASAAQPAKRAAGAGAHTASGKQKDRAASAQRDAARLALKAKWGADIQAKVQRNLRYPRGLKTDGTAKLALYVAPDGRLQKLALTRSSGNDVLDDAALRAVKRAGRFSQAPDGLTETVYAFSLSLSFRR